MPVETGTTTGSSAGGSPSGGQGGQNSGLTTGYVGAAGTNRGAWSGDGQYLGLSTGPKIYGNTVYGPSGGSAIAHATMSPGSMAGMGMGPTNETYSNFNTPSGQPMFSNVGGQSFTAPNFSGAMQQASLANQRMMAGTQRPGATSAPPPPVAPPPAQPPRPRFREVPAWYTNMFGRNPTSFPQWSSGYHQPGNYPGPPNDPVAALQASYRGPNPSIGGAPSAPPGSTVSKNNQGNTAGYAGSSGWGPGGHPEGGYGSGGAQFGY